MNSSQVKVPDQLNITIRTSIPGYQMINYKPSMTINNTDETIVRFNPLIKLKQPLLDKIPKDYKIKQFFNKSLFQSLLNYNGGIPVKSLLQATRSGIVDNNINVTLNEIFPVGSVITIAKKQYVIGDVQWTSGNWKIDIKQKKTEIDPNKITDPVLYTQLVNNEIISGEEELSQIPQSILTGSNYVGAFPTAKGVQREAELPAKPVEEFKPVVEPIKPLVEPIKPVVEPIKPVVEPLKKEPLAIEMPMKKEPLAIEMPIKKEPLAIGPMKKEPIKQLPYASSHVEEISPEEERMFEDLKKDLQINTQETKFIRTYFKQTNYFGIVKYIFNRFPPSLKNGIKQFYFITTNYQPPAQNTSISPTSYNMLCDQENIIKSVGDGDCFFTSVANGINIYNSENQDSKIIFSNYGKTELFTVAIIREIVLRYISNLSPEIIQDMLAISEEQVEPLNDQFKTAINGLKSALQGLQPSQEQYMTELNNVYYANSNFLVYKPTVVPIDIDIYDNPFRILEEKEIAKYIKSKAYWANNVAIEAVCDILHICVIPIEKYKYGKTIKLKPVNVDRLKTLLVDNELATNKCSKKIMFLYYTNGNHYELASFKYKTKEKIKLLGEGIRKIKEYTDKSYTIFKDDDIMPPIHILFLIYGTIYSKLDEPSKDNFVIYKTVMSNIELAIKKILASDDKIVFVKIFDDIFPSRKSIGDLITQTNTNELTGGYTVKNYNYNYPAKITKPTEDSNSSKLSYDITIDMELFLGTSLTPEQRNEAKCNNKYNAVKRSFAEFTGKPYIITPIYSTKKVEQIKNNKTRKHPH